MTDVTQILNAISRGEERSSDRLLSLVYEELRKLAASKMSSERPDQTLQATALVHEAFLRIVGVDAEQEWNNRGHFFGAAAEAMRRILVENARRKQQLKRGGQFKRVELNDVEIETEAFNEDLVALDEALVKLKVIDSDAAQLVQLRYFTGLPIAEAAEMLGVSPRSADRLWSFARAWLYREIRAGK